jgi:hypothetical protein
VAAAAGSWIGTSVGTGGMEGRGIELLLCSVDPMAAQTPPGGDKITNEPLLLQRCNEQ